MSIDIIGVGSPIVDSLAHVEESFIDGIRGEKGGMELVSTGEMGELFGRLGQLPVQSPGGSAANSIFAMAHLGAATTFLGKVGNCAVADFFEKSYAGMGGDASRLKRGDIDNGRCLSLVTPDSERTMRTDLGAAMTLTPAEITAADFEGCRHAHIEGYLLFNRDLLRHVLNCAKEAGLTISLDLASFEVVQAAGDHLSNILEHDIDVVFANEEEAEAFFNEEDCDYSDLARRLSEFCKIGVVKVGAKGAYIAEAGEVHRIEPVLAPHLTDTTAAGDFWAAGFLYGWLKGHPHVESGRLASELGAEVVQVMGSTLPEATWKKLRKSAESLAQA